ncbi:MAG: DUF1016 N-terminal domain-containing protein, partial [Erysipelotrichaceae bacterium]|nr:DUF1016 N-terminal domain-containing protein [Erysipelotrichaceae bacterium]
MDELKNNQNFNELITDIEILVKNSRENVSVQINNTITQTYWTIGKYIVEFEQDGNHRAEYGKQLIPKLANELTQRIGKGFGITNLVNMRRFYLRYPILNISPKLTWSHICELVKIDDDLERKFYEKQCVIDYSQVMSPPFAYKSPPFY